MCFASLDDAPTSLRDVRTHDFMMQIMQQMQHVLGLKQVAKGKTSHNPQFSYRHTISIGGSNPPSSDIKTTTPHINTA